MSRRVCLVLFVAAGLMASSCAGDESVEPGGGSDDEVDVPALIGIERNVADGARRVDTTIDPDELEPPPPPRSTIGDLPIPCGPSKETPAQGDTPGLTAESITIGTGNDRGGLYTALSGRGIPDTIRVLADRCNALGGINGRVVVVDEHDAAVLEVVERMQVACESNFALVGHGYLLDTVGDVARVECGLPAFPAWTTMRPGAEALVVAAVPSQPDHMVLDGLALAVFAAGEDGARIGVVVPATDGGLDAAARIQAAIVGAQLDIEAFVFEYPIDRPADWGAIVASASSAGVGVVWVEGSCGSTLVPLMEAAGAIGWRPAVAGDSDLYDPYCSSVNATLVDGTILTMDVFPAEDRGSVAAVDEHVQLLRAAGIDPTADALRAASAFWLWASAMADCAEPLTRECVVANAEAVDEWTAGGLHPATDPGSWADAGCFAMVSVVNGAFERVVEGSQGEMDCEPDVWVELG
jgi:ABC-type branched-subunit amino acid transport system substrate-binding protein